MRSGKNLIHCGKKTVDIFRRCGIMYQTTKQSSTCVSPQGSAEEVNRFDFCAISLRTFRLFDRRRSVQCLRLFLFGGASTISVKDVAINEEINEKEVRLVDSDGSQLGIVSSKEALKMAAQKDLDLVLIAPQAKPPVCKIMDYGKYRFEALKREKEAKKNQKTVELKEIRLGLSIDTHDFETKGNQAKKFLSSGYKVKASIRFRGRELGHPEIGTEIMKRFAEYCSEVSVVEKPAKMESRNMLMFLAPKSDK